jgi:hypothetical protein
MRLVKSIARAALLVGLLSGCAGSMEDLGGKMWVAPGKYDTYTCKQVTGMATGYRAQVNAIKEVKEKASTSPGGTAVGMIAYQTEYMQMRAEVQELDATIERKNCKNESNRPSERSVY